MFTIFITHLFEIKMENYRLSKILLCAKFTTGNNETIIAIIEELSAKLMKLKIKLSINVSFYLTMSHMKKRMVKVYNETVFNVFKVGYYVQIQNLFHKNWRLFADQTSKVYQMVCYTSKKTEIYKNCTFILLSETKETANLNDGGTDVTIVGKISKVFTLQSLRHKPKPVSVSICWQH